MAFLEMREQLKGLPTVWPATRFTCCVHQRKRPSAKKQHKVAEPANPR
ncbi:hypothetical protein NOR53_2176 [gamma proteobacterium NOR5-3]|nr:hypothetical protein NOR53_2176 [gamma proteobacterium NOR5-3]